MSTHTTKPFLKWAGSKFRVLPNLARVFPPAELGYHAYAEPFLGAGSVFLNLARRASPVVLNDLNEDLILVYRTIMRATDEVVDETRVLFRDHNNEEAYWAMVEEFNNCQGTEVRRAALFIYLNRHGFNGLCRYNAKGEFNVPYGRYRSSYFPEAEIRSAAVLLQRPELTLSSDDFGAVFERVARLEPTRFIVYADPPYARLTRSSSFTSYAASGFDWTEHERLVQAARDSAAAGAWVILSNHSTPAVRELYRGAGMLEIPVRRKISAAGESRGLVQEILAVFAPAAYHAAFAKRLARIARETGFAVILPGTFATDSKFASGSLENAPAGSNLQLSLLE